jgi:hypothetical protein
MENSDILYGYLVYFTVIRYILWSFGMLYKGKSGNPATHHFSAGLTDVKIIATKLGKQTE